jgi:(p)ppGpp synthase/HD superfamily hydrolase
MEKSAEELYSGFNEGYEDFPLTFEWKKALEFATEKHKDQSKEGKMAYFAYLKEVMTILVDESEVTDDGILCMAALHKTLETTDCTYEELEEKFDDEIAGCVQSLTRKQNQSFEEYSKEIFTNEEFPYAREIELAIRLCELRNMSKDNDDEIIQMIQETEKYILPYENSSPRVLMRKIKEEIADLKGQKDIRTNDER